MYEIKGYNMQFWANKSGDRNMKDGFEFQAKVQVVSYFLFFSRTFRSIPIVMAYVLQVGVGVMFKIFVKNLDCYAWKLFWRFGTSTNAILDTWTHSILLVKMWYFWSESINFFPDVYLKVFLFL